MKCLMKYPWVKLPRNRVPAGNGNMGAWMRLAARAAFRKGEARYCGYNNPVEPGMWVGGIVGLKAILGLRRRDAALDVLRELERLGFLSWSLDPSTKKLSYTLSDWLVRFCGAECPDGAVCATDGYGFVCVSREITQRLNSNLLMSLILPMCVISWSLSDVLLTFILDYGIVISTVVYI